VAATGKRKETAGGTLPEDGARYEIAAPAFGGLAMTNSYCEKAKKEESAC